MRSIQYLLLVGLLRICIVSTIYTIYATTFEHYDILHSAIPNICTITMHCYIIRRIHIVTWLRITVKVWVYAFQLHMCLQSWIWCGICLHIFIYTLLHIRSDIETYTYTYIYIICLFLQLNTTYGWFANVCLVVAFITYNHVLYF